MSYLGRPYSHTKEINQGMVEKGLERESDEAIVGVKTEGLKRFIVQIVTKKIVHDEPEIGWI